MFAVTLFGCKVVPPSRVRIKHLMVPLVEAPMGFFFPIPPSSAASGLLLFPGTGCHLLIYPPKKCHSQILWGHKSSLSVDSPSLEVPMVRLDRVWWN